MTCSCVHEGVWRIYHHPKAENIHSSAPHCLRVTIEYLVHDQVSAALAQKMVAKHESPDTATPMDTEVGLGFRV
jgi:hypothetical protein